jgi:hypothetical protein
VVEKFAVSLCYTYRISKAGGRQAMDTPPALDLFQVVDTVDEA